MLRDGVLQCETTHLTTFGGVLSIPTSADELFAELLTAVQFNTFSVDEMFDLLANFSFGENLTIMIVIIILLFMNVCSLTTLGGYRGYRARKRRERDGIMFDLEEQVKEVNDMSNKLGKLQRASVMQEAREALRPEALRHSLKDAAANTRDTISRASFATPLKHSPWSRNSVRGSGADGNSGRESNTHELTTPQREWSLVDVTPTKTPVRNVPLPAPKPLSMAQEASPRGNSGPTTPPPSPPDTPSNAKPQASPDEKHDKDNVSGLSAIGLTPVKELIAQARRLTTEPPQAQEVVAKARRLTMDTKRATGTLCCQLLDTARSEHTVINLLSPPDDPEALTPAQMVQVFWNTLATELFVCCFQYQVPDEPEPASAPVCGGRTGRKCDENGAPQGGGSSDGFVSNFTIAPVTALTQGVIASTIAFFMIFICSYAYRWGNSRARRPRKFVKKLRRRLKRAIRCCQHTYRRCCRLPEPLDAEGDLSEATQGPSTPRAADGTPLIKEQELSQLGWMVLIFGCILCPGFNLLALCFCRKTRLVPIPSMAPERPGPPAEPNPRSATCAVKGVRVGNDCGNSTGISVAGTAKGNPGGGGNATGTSCGLKKLPRGRRIFKPLPREIRYISSRIPLASTPSPLPAPVDEARPTASNEARSPEQVTPPSSTLHCPPSLSHSNSRRTAPVLESTHSSTGSEARHTDAENFTYSRVPLRRTPVARPPMAASGSQVPSPLKWATPSFRATVAYQTPTRHECRGHHHLTTSASCAGPLAASPQPAATVDVDGSCTAVELPDHQVLEQLTTGMARDSTHISNVPSTRSNMHATAANFVFSRVPLSKHPAPVLATSASVPALPSLWASPVRPSANASVCTSASRSPLAASLQPAAANDRCTAVEAINHDRDVSACGTEALDVLPITCDACPSECVTMDRGGSSKVEAVTEEPRVTSGSPPPSPPSSPSPHHVSFEEPGKSDLVVEDVPTPFHLRSTRQSAIPDAYDGYCATRLPRSPLPRTLTSKQTIKEGIRDEAAEELTASPCASQTPQIEQSSPISHVRRLMSPRVPPTQEAYSAEPYLSAVEVEESDLHGRGSSSRAPGTDLALVGNATWREPAGVVRQRSTLRVALFPSDAAQGVEEPIGGERAATAEAVCGDLAAAPAGVRRAKESIVGCLVKRDTGAALLAQSLHRGPSAPEPGLRDSCTLFQPPLKLKREGVSGGCSAQAPPLTSKLTGWKSAKSLIRLDTDAIEAKRQAAEAHKKMQVRIIVLCLDALISSMRT